jgi:hypothetical protein
MNGVAKKIRAIFDKQKKKHTWSCYTDELEKEVLAAVSDLEWRLKHREEAIDRFKEAMKSNEKTLFARIEMLELRLSEIRKLVEDKYDFFLKSKPSALLWREEHEAHLITLEELKKLSDGGEQQ